MHVHQLGLYAEVIHSFSGDGLHQQPAGTTGKTWGRFHPSAPSDSGIMTTTVMYGMRVSRSTENMAGDYLIGGDDNVEVRFALHLFLYSRSLLFASNILHYTQTRCKSTWMEGSIYTDQWWNFRSNSTEAHQLTDLLSSLSQLPKTDRGLRMRWGPLLFLLPWRYSRSEII